MKKVFRLGLGSLLMLTAVTGCDTREDWFKKEGEGATFIFQNGDRRDTIDMTGERCVDYTIRLCRLKNGMGYSDTLSLQVYGITNKQSIPARISYVSVDESGSANLSISKESEGTGVEVWFQGNISNRTLFSSDTAAAVIGTTRLMVTMKDIFDNEYYSYIRVTLLGDCPPVPVLEVQDVDGQPLEKVLSLSGSYDNDGTVCKYEYCIDGNIVSYKVTSNSFESNTGVWQGGKAAYGGTYITATALESISHAFQTYGEHTVYYRCMDDMGAWSTWKKETITISE